MKRVEKIMWNENLERKLPKMILFDYGHTLLYESGFDDTKGYEALLPYATRNENNLSAAEIAAVATELFMDIGRHSRNHGVEIHDHMFQRLLFEYLELDFSLSRDELDCLYWENAAPGAPMPNVLKLLDFINKKGIRSGVISNISFSEYTLSERINRLLPNNRFEFIMASSEYVYRKPNKILFEVALKKAHLKPEEVWFCGDHPQFDVVGAASAGIFPVWYQSNLECPYRKGTEDDKPECAHLHIHDWEELISILNNSYV
jgi:putative hydrolase of the HAD superfamily